jgi:two-component system NarL family sensor kinase
MYQIVIRINLYGKKLVSARLWCRMSLPREPAPSLSRISNYPDKVEKGSFSRIASELIATNQQLAEAREQNAASERERISVEQKLRAANEQLDLKIQERTSELTRSNQLLHREIEKRVQTEEMLRKLSARILTLQDEERRRLGRELHDSAGQLLAALHINLGVIAQRTQNDPSLSATVADSAALADQVISEIRTLSYLLHPPMLDETGLASAVEWYARGFSDRSKIEVNLDIDAALPRFPTEVETAIFRIVQESLVNIHRHSGSHTAFISLHADVEGALLTIRDEGCGIRAEILKNMEEGGGNIGVGICGMRERARQLGGTISIRRSNPGTLVEVNLPVMKYASGAAVAGGDASR